MSYFDFEWGREGNEKADRIRNQLIRKDEAILSGVSGLLMASVVTARGRRMSPSSILEKLIESKRRTNPFIVDQIADAWNVMSDVAATTSDRIDVLTDLITPRHRNKTGISETLRYQIIQTYESFIDFWITVADMMTGFRSVSSKVFGVGESVGVGEYLHRGMTRSQLLRAFGHDLKPIEDEDTGE